MNLNEFFNNPITQALSCLAALAIASALLNDRVRNLLSSFFDTLKGRLTWNRIERDVKKLAKRLQDGGVSPDRIICVGRGGTIAGALLAFELDNKGERQISLLSLNVNHNGAKKEVTDQPLWNKLGDTDFNSSSVLVLFSEIQSGQTYRIVKEFLDKLGIKNAAFASLYTKKELPTWDFSIKYFGDDSETKRIKFPWGKNQGRFTDNHPVA
ncbi:MAG: hypothetical protein LBR07_09030 [Puniceicoccales bacterium]|jgi:hypoxanthine phosphoribosyltransferase|nr:hypothetical protein [Puniceicoccales bacterium]